MYASHVRVNASVSLICLLPCITTRQLTLMLLATYASQGADFWLGL